MNPYKSKIKCLKCGKNYKRIKENGKYKFICGGYSNQNGCTERLVISEESIRELICRRYEKELTDNEIYELVDKILIEDRHLFEIHFTDGSKPILIKRNFFQF